MYNIVTIREADPKESFNGIWVNKKNGNIFIWVSKPVVIGSIMDGKMVRPDVFKCEFKHEEKRNLQKYEYEFEYTGFPMFVLASIKDDDYDGENVDIFFGDMYGCVDGEGDWIVNQMGNVKLGEKLKVRCKPSKGTRRVDIIVLSYE